jgi:diguanylate cyclase (GGDEF)-like protein
MFKLLTDPRPSTAVVDPRKHLYVQLAIPALMLVWLLWRWRTFSHPLAALVGVVLLFVLVALLELGARSATTASGRLRVICCAAAASVLTVAINGGIASPLAVVFLLAVLSGTLVRGSREVDLGVGAALGALLALAYEGNGLLALLQFALAALAITTVVRALERLLARSRDEANLDPLTGVLNRAAFSRMAEGRLTLAATGTRWGAIMLDLDDFGALNKRHGHLTGDAVLIAATQRLKSAACQDGIVGRLGGDEFAALVPASRAEPIARGLAHTLATGGRSISASIGVTRGGPAASEWMGLLREADVALRAAKRDGKNQVVVFDESIEAEEHSSRCLVADVIERDRIEIVVQPIVDLASGAIHAYEALARFDDATARSPARWLALAEPVGMRVDLEVSCLRHSLALLDDLAPGVLLSVNVSAQALHDPRIRGLLLESSPHSLILELTEEGLVRDLGHLRADLDPLLERGVKLAIDDMGAGYSNLRQVTALAPSLLKLDRTLVHGIDAAPTQTVLIDALTGYAQRTGAQIVAEGIETAAELEVLRALGITYGQGYLLAAPAPPWPQVSLEPAGSIHSQGPAQGSRPVTIDARVTSDQARRKFAALPELESLTIIDDERRPLGLITRHRLLTTLGHRFGHALWGEKPVMSIADTRCLCLPADTPIGELARQSLARRLEHRHDPVLLVDERGRLTGQVTMGDMLFAGYLDRREVTTSMPQPLGPAGTRVQAGSPAHGD